MSLTEGQVLIDGRDYRERSQLWLQASLGYVLQTPHLFSGTIADNIRYGRKSATDEEVRAAARMVHAEEFILKQEHGYDTEVGEGGVRLSTGEKQLFLFARVISCGSAHLCAGRGDKLHRYGDGATHSGRNHKGACAPHKLHCGAPTLHNPQCGSHPCDPRRPDYGKRHASRALETARVLLRPVHHAVPRGSGKRNPELKTMGGGSGSSLLPYLKLKRNFC